MADRLIARRSRSRHTSRFWLMLVGTYLALACGPSVGRAAEHPDGNAAPGESKLLSSAGSVFVREFRFQGNTVFSSADLAKVANQYTGRTNTFEDLEVVRRLLTLHYVNAGFINSGAVLDDQNVADGVVTYRIVEGILSEITIEGTNWRGGEGWLRDSFVRGRAERWAGPPLNVNELKEGLQLLRQNPNISQINAELKPGLSPGQSALDLKVKEANPFRLGLEFSNDRPPSVGAEELSLQAAHRNLTGHSDILDITYGIIHEDNDGFTFSEFDNFAGFYVLPINSYDTTIEVHGEKSDAPIVEEPFDSLDIQSKSYTVGTTVRHPFVRTANREFALALTFDREHSKSYLLGEPYSVSPGAEDGVMDLSVIRFAQEWTDRSLNQVFAARSTFNWGVPVFGTTDDGSDRDATFFSWIGQVQYVRRLFDTANQVILRANGQYTPDPLLALEQMSVGGMESVRGYRENQLVRDTAFFASAEFRCPVLTDKKGNNLVQLAPFFDAGGAWNVEDDPPGPNTIYSVGIGVLVDPNRHLSGRLYYGYPFETIKNQGGNLQDIALHFRITVELF
jgi:hemolysin activation/secretion protein